MSVNYYEILELPLDPPITDTKTALAALDKAIQVWNKKRQVVQFRALSEQAPAMRKELSDPQKLKALGEATRKKKLDEIRKHLAAYAEGKGYILKDEVRRIESVYTLIRPATIQKLIDEKGYQVRESPTVEEFVEPTRPEPPQGVSMIPDAQLESLYDYLRVISPTATLFTELGASETASLAELQKKANEYRQRARRIPDKRSVLADAKTTIAGLAVRFTSTQESLKGFLYYWKLFLIKKSIEPTIKMRQIGDPPTIDLPSYRALIEDCIKNKMPKHEAEWYIFSRCGSMLRAIQRRCPKCKKGVNNTEIVCAACGFNLEDMPKASALIAEAKQDYANGKLNDAQRKAQAALIYWPNNADAEQVIEQIKSAIEIQKLREQEKIEAEKQKKRDEDKKRVASLLTLISPPDSARVLSSNSRAAVITWTAAKLNGKVLQDRYKLPDGTYVPVKYMLVRKENAIPASTADGKVIIETASLKFEDTNVEPGIVYGYCVFAILDQFTSQRGTACGKYQFIPPAEAITPVSGNGNISLSWRTARNSCGHILVRKEGAIPSSLNDGKVIRLEACSTSYTDSGLTNGKRYGYLLAHEYRDENGKAIFSKPVGASSVPIAPPRGLESTEWNCTFNQGKIVTTWKKTPAGSVGWYLSRAPLASPGTLLEQNDRVLSAATPFSYVEDKACKASHPIHLEGRMCVTPVIKTSTHILVCACKYISNIASVNNLQAVRNDGNLILTWTWPPQCSEVLITYSVKGYPTDPTDPRISGSTTCSKSTYSYNNYHMIRNVAPAPLYISVFAKCSEGGETTYSSPQSVLSVGTAGRCSIEYKIYSTGGFLGFGTKKWFISISAANGVLPDLMLRKKKDNKPINRTDGLLLMDIPGGSSKVELPLNISGADNGMILSLFVKNTEQSNLYQINHPELNKSKIN